MPNWAASDFPVMRLRAIIARTSALTPWLIRSTVAILITQHYAAL